MPERIQQILNRIVEWWKHFSTRQKALIISIAAVVAVAFSILGFVMTRPTMVNLITCDSAKQASSVKDLLDSNSITYEVSDDGLTYTVKHGFAVHGLVISLSFASRPIAFTAAAPA